ncbi:MAG: leucine-rich repeat domain-containing protein [Reichenbachiella sp.]|uniref:leucine-rich repeat domain-containing protein n=2 Tax=Reichenbachiella sp. TaxID=2184521 RepID=UPI003298DB8E
MKYLFSFLLSLAFITSHAQVAQDSARYDEVRSLVNFYKYMLNTVGSGKNSTRDKEVIIAESYKKVFKDQFVQIEDDLALDRKVITNKDVSAYLRDVDFFFENIQFDFQDVSIEKVNLEDGSYYFLASFESTITGITYDGQTQNQSQKRFIELNLDEQASDLKIVSVYSTKVSREKELQLWWESLPFEWITIFNQQVAFDSISGAALKRIAAIDSLDVSDNVFIQDLEALSALKDLKYLDISNTKVTDLNPLRYARNLKTLNASNTKVTDLSVVQYFPKLKSINLAQTPIQDITEIGRLNHLDQLNLSATTVADFNPIKTLKALKLVDLSNTKFDDPTLLASCKELKKANLSRTQVDHLFVFQSLLQVEFLDLSESKIANLNGLEKHPSLQELYINQTAVKVLAPVGDNPRLKKIYADLSGVSEQVASDFMTQHPQIVVVTNSEQVMKWWIELPANWKNVFAELIGHNEPTKEDLAKLLIIDSLNVANRKLYMETPLVKFKRLKYLDVSHNDFVTLDFTKEMPELEYLIGINLPIESTDDLSSNKKLKHLNLSQTKLKNMKTLEQLHSLEHVDVEGTFVEEPQVIEHLNTNPNTVIIYQSDSLLAWWNNISPVWQTVFNLPASDAYHLHQLIEKKEIDISNKPVQSLAPLQAFINLKSVSMDQLKLTHLSELYVISSLEELSYTNGPLQTLAGIDQLAQLKSLNISNTAIEDLKDLYYLSSLENLNCSRTGIKNLKGVDKLVNMENMDISNTRIWRLDRLASMRRIKTLICNNTRLSQAKVDAFKADRPDCDITFY